MGCTSSRHTGTTDEQTIAICESRLNIHKYKSEVIDQILRNYAQADQDLCMNMKHFQAFKTHLNLKTNDSQQGFFKRFVNNQKINATDLLIYFILLGQGQPQLKARLLYHILDPLLNDKISPNHVQVLFYRIYTILTHYSVELVPENDGGLPQTNKSKVNQYVKQLQYVRDDAVKKIVEDINKKVKSAEIDSEQFASAFVGDETLASYMTTTGIRQVGANLVLQNGEKVLKGVSDNDKQLPLQANDLRRKLHEQLNGPQQALRGVLAVKEETKGPVTQQNVQPSINSEQQAGQVQSGQAESQQDTVNSGQGVGVAVSEGVGNADGHQPDGEADESQ